MAKKTIKLMIGVACSLLGVILVSQIIITSFPTKILSLGTFTLILGVIGIGYGVGQIADYLSD